MNLFVKQKLSRRSQNQTYSYQRGNVGESDKWGGWDEHIHTAVNKIKTYCIAQGALSTRYSVMIYKEKKPEKEERYMDVDRYSGSAQKCVG